MQVAWKTKTERNDSQQVTHTYRVDLAFHPSMPGLHFFQVVDVTLNLVEDFCTDSDPMLSRDVNIPCAAFRFMKHENKTGQSYGKC